MNFTKVVNGLHHEMKHIDFDIKEEVKEHVIITANIVAKDYFDDGVFCKISAYSNGNLDVTFVFDRLEPTLRSLTLVNEYNTYSFIGKAFIEERGDNNQYLVVRYRFLACPDEDHIVASILIAFRDLLDEDSLRHLQPLTRLTN